LYEITSKPIVPKFGYKCENEHEYGFN